MEVHSEIKVRLLATTEFVFNKIIAPKSTTSRHQNTSSIPKCRDHKIFVNQNFYKKILPVCISRDNSSVGNSLIKIGMCTFFRMSTNFSFFSQEYDVLEHVRFLIIAFCENN